MQPQSASARTYAITCNPVEFTTSVCTKAPLISSSSSLRTRIVIFADEYSIKSCQFHIPSRVAPAHAYSSRASAQMNFSQLVLAYWFTSCIYLLFGRFFFVSCLRPFRLLSLAVLDNNTVDWNNNFGLLSMEHLAAALSNVSDFFFRFNECCIDCGFIFGQFWF